MNPNLYILPAIAAPFLYAEQNNASMPSPYYQCSRIEIIEFQDFPSMPAGNRAAQFLNQPIDSTQFNVSRVSSKVDVDEKLKSEFDSLVKQWQDEILSISSTTKMFNHPSYVRIMAMGTDGLPLVLRELQKNSGRWFYALKFMAGTDVAAGIKSYEDARSAWLEWGYKNNYI